MAELSDERIESIKARGEALKRWSENETLSLPENFRETMSLVSDDLTALLDERKRLSKKEGDRCGRKKRTEKRSREG